MKRWMALCALLCLLLTGCSSSDLHNEQEAGFLVYYVTAEGSAYGSDALCGAKTDLVLSDDVSLQKKAEAVVQKMQERPADPLLRSALPENAELLGVTIQGRRATVDFSAEISLLSGVELTLANSCLVMSLSQLENINSVTITAQGRPVAPQSRAVFYEWNILLSSTDDVLQTVDATLYFIDAEGKLVGEERILEIYEGQTVAENLILELMRGPENRELSVVFPEGFQISSVRVENGVCYVNLPAASLELLGTDETWQLQMLQCLANSLYSIDSVEKLRLLADGVELEYFGAVPVSTVSERPQE